MGQKVEIYYKEKSVKGIIVWEHNTGRLIIYSENGRNLEFFLKGGEIIRFDNDQNDYIITKNLIKFR